MSWYSETSSMLCGTPSPDRSFTDSSISRVSGGSERLSNASASDDGILHTEMSVKQGLHDGTRSHDTCEPFGPQSEDVHREDIDLSITHQMCGMSLEETTHEHSNASGHHINCDIDSDLEVATKELSFDISREVNRIYKRVREEVAKTRTFLTGTKTNNSEINASSLTHSPHPRQSEARDSASICLDKTTNHLQWNSSNGRNGKMSLSSTMSEFAPAVMSTPNYKRNEDSMEQAGDFTFEPWTDGDNEWNETHPTISISTPTNKSGSASLSSSVIINQMRLANANRVSPSSSSIEPDSLSVHQNRGNHSTICCELSIQDDFHSDWERESDTFKTFADESKLLQSLSIHRNSEETFRSVEKSRDNDNFAQQSRNTSYLSTVTGTSRGSKLRLDPFARYMDERRRVDAINEKDDNSDYNAICDSAPQNSIRVHIGSFAVPSDNNRTPRVSSPNLMCSSRESVRQSMTPLPRKRSLSAGDVTEFRSANMEDSALKHIVSIGGNDTERSDIVVSPMSHDHTNLSTQQCEMRQMLSVNFNGVAADKCEMSDKSAYEYDIEIDNRAHHVAKPTASQWRNGKYFSEAWERFVSRKLLCDMNMRLSDMEDSDFDVFIPEEILKKASTKLLAATRQSVRRAVRHIRDDPRMAQILLDYTGDVADVSAARRHYKSTVHNDTALADLTQSFTSALDHFLSFTEESNKNETTFLSVMEEK